MKTKIFTSKQPCPKEIIERIAQIHTETLGNTAVKEYWVKQDASDFEKTCLEPEFTCVVGELNGKIIGFAYGYKVSACAKLDDYLNPFKPYNREYFHLDEVAVIPEYQEGGFGERLVTQILGAQTCAQALLLTENQGQLFHIVAKLNAEIILHVQCDEVIMRIPTGK